MIYSGKYLSKSLELLNELKNSLDIETRQAIYKTVYEDDKEYVKIFIKENNQEIFKFMRATPSKRKSTKKWQKDINLYTYFSYNLTRKTMNNFFMVDWRFLRQDSYKTDIAKVAELLSTIKEYSIPNKFFDKDDHKPIPFIQDL